MEHEESFAQAGAHAVNSPPRQAVRYSLTDYLPSNWHRHNTAPLKSRIFCKRERAPGPLSPAPRLLHTPSSPEHPAPAPPDGQAMCSSTHHALRLLTTAVMTLSSFFIFFCNKLKTLVANAKWVPFEDEQQETSTAMITWKVTLCFRLKDSFSPTLIKSSTFKNKQGPWPVALGLRPFSLPEGYLRIVFCISSQMTNIKRESGSNY